MWNLTLGDGNLTTLSCHSDAPTATKSQTQFMHYDVRDPHGNYYSGVLLPFSR